jgi:hypothetical protein
MGSDLNFQAKDVATSNLTDVMEVGWSMVKDVDTVCGEVESSSCF